MKLALLGVGNAGTRLVEALLSAEADSGRPFVDDQVLVFNTSRSAFAEVDHIDEDRQVLIGDTHPDVVSETASNDRDGDSDSNADGERDRQPERREGVGGDPELGVEVARDDLPEIRRALDSVDDTEVDAAMIVTGLGGGTGCGVGSVLLEELQSIYEVPVYVLGVLPSSGESDRRAWTAGRAIRTVVPLADAVVPVDNEAWVGSTDGPYAEANEAIATRFVSVFGAGERDDELLSELRMDPNDIMRTLDVGGLATIGHTTRDLDPETDGWITKLRRLLGLSVPEPEAQTDAMTIKGLVKQALESKLTLPCDVASADRVLLVLSGPPKELSRKGFETGRKLLEDETGTVEILAGDEPLTDASTVSATVLLSNVTDVPRIEALQRRAVAFQREQEGSHQADRQEIDGQPEADDRPAGDRQPVDQSSTEQSVDDEHGFDFQGEELVDHSAADDSADNSAADETPPEPSPDTSAE